jgi:hypothetical protein
MGIVSPYLIFDVDFHPEKFVIFIGHGDFGRHEFFPLTVDVGFLKNDPAGKSDAVLFNVEFRDESDLRLGL